MTTSPSPGTVPESEIENVRNIFIRHVAQNASQDLGYLKQCCIELGNLLEKPRDDGFLSKAGVAPKESSIENAFHRQGRDRGEKDSLDLTDVFQFSTGGGSNSGLSFFGQFFNSEYHQKIAKGQYTVLDNSQFSDKKSTYPGRLEGSSNAKYSGVDTNFENVLQMIGTDELKISQFCQILERAVLISNKSSLQNISMLTNLIFNIVTPTISTIVPLGRTLLNIIYFFNPVLISPNDEYIKHANQFGVVTWTLPGMSSDFPYAQLNTKFVQDPDKFTLFLYVAKKSFVSTIFSKSNMKYYGQYLLSYFILKYVQTRLVVAVASELLGLDSNWWKYHDNPPIKQTDMTTYNSITLTRLKDLDNVLKNMVRNTQFYMVDFTKSSAYSDLFEPLSVHVLLEKSIVNNSFKLGNNLDEMYYKFEDSLVGRYISSLGSQALPKESSTETEFQNVITRMKNMINLFDICSVICTHILLTKRVYNNLPVGISLRKVFEYNGSLIAQKTLPILRNILSLLEIPIKDRHIAMQMMLSSKPTDQNISSGSGILLLMGLSYEILTRNPDLFSPFYQNASNMISSLMYYPRVFKFKIQTSGTNTYYDYTNSLATVLVKKVVSEVPQSSIGTTIYEIVDSWTKPDKETYISELLPQSKILTSDFGINNVNTELRPIFRDVFYKGIHFLNPNLHFHGNETKKNRLSTLSRVIHHNVFWVGDLPHWMDLGLFQKDSTEKYVSVTTAVLPLKSVMPSLRNAIYSYKTDKPDFTLETSYYESYLDHSGEKFTGTCDRHVYDKVKINRSMNPDSYSINLHDGKVTDTQLWSTIQFVMNGKFLSKIVLYLNEVINKYKNATKSSDGTSKSNFDIHGFNYWTFANDTFVQSEFSGELDIFNTDFEKMEKIASLISNSFIVLYSIKIGNDVTASKFANLKRSKCLMDMRDMIEYSRAKSILKFTDVFKNRDNKNGDNLVPMIIDSFPQVHKEFVEELSIQILKSPIIEKDFSPVMINKIVPKNNVIQTKFSIDTVVQLAGNDVDSGSVRSRNGYIDVTMNPFIVAYEKPGPKTNEQKKTAIKLEKNNTNFTIHDDDGSTKTISNYNFKLDRSICIRCNNAVPTKEFNGTIDSTSLHVNADKSSFEDNSYLLYHSIFKTSNNWIGFYERLRQSAISKSHNLEKMPHAQVLKEVDCCEIPEDELSERYVPQVPMKYLPLINNETFEFDPITVSRSIFDRRSLISVAKSNKDTVFEIFTREHVDNVKQDPQTTNEILFYLPKRLV